MSNLYDVIIIGAGPAGLSAALYAGRARLSTLMIEKGHDGGQIAITSSVKNYPGSIDNETGHTLSERMSKQAKEFGAERISDTVERVELEGDIKRVVGAKDTYEGKTLIVATGTLPRPIGCENEDKFVGKGISYCATCDAELFEDFEVYVVGGGNPAVEESIYLAKFARKVTIIYQKDKLFAVPSLQEKAAEVPNIELMLNTVVESVDGDELLESMTVRDVKSGEVRTIEPDPDDGIFGLFGFVGYTSRPNSGLFEGMLDMEEGFLKTDEDMHTNIPGVFAAGDIRVKKLRQVVTATADGAIAATEALKYINDKGKD